jgi:hypothetical protein
LRDAGRRDEAREAFQRGYLRMQRIRETLRHERLRDAFEKSGELRLVQDLIAGAV